jgi:hypothetical protein
MDSLCDFFFINNILDVMPQSIKIFILKNESFYHVMTFSKDVNKFAVFSLYNIIIANKYEDKYKIKILSSK